MRYDHLNSKILPEYWPGLIAHDPGASGGPIAVAGGRCYGDRLTELVGVGNIHELPNGLFGSELASALAKLVKLYPPNALIIADLTNDLSYGEMLVKKFPGRFCAIQIADPGAGECRLRSCRAGTFPLYVVSRGYLLRFLNRELKADRVEFATPQATQHVRQELARLVAENKRSATTAVRHDDITTSIAMLVWVVRQVVPQRVPEYANVRSQAAKGRCVKRRRSSEALVEIDHDLAA